MLTGSAKFALSACLLLALCPGAARSQEGGKPAGGTNQVEGWLKEAATALKEGNPTAAVEVSGKVLKEDPRNLQALLFRGAGRAMLRDHEKAIEDYSQAIGLAPRLAAAYQQRGLQNFRAGHVAESLKDFDKYIELEPEAKVSHWQRGISCYYAGKFKEGQEQFEGYQDFDDSDVENAVWRYLCMVPTAGKEEARAKILKVKDDARVPMKEVYELFAGKDGPEAVLEAARAGEPSEDELNARLFYAHLYLGLYYESEGLPGKALTHLAIAADNHRIGHYMWDVARVHRDILRKRLGEQGKQE